MNGTKPFQAAREASLPGAAASAGTPTATEAHVFDRLATVRLPLIALVVCYHNEAGGNFIESLQGSPMLRSIVDLVANGLGGIRVPVFFLIAGYVFFRNFAPGIAWFKSKIGSRARSVLLPLILWSVLWMGLIALAQQLPFLDQFFVGKSLWSAPLAEFSPREFFWLIFGDISQLFLYHLWFLRDLFILVLLTPLIYVAIRVSKGWVIYLLLVGWALGVENRVISNDALFFFFAGAHLSITGRSIFFADRVGLIAVLGWIALRAFDVNAFALGQASWVLCGIVATLYLSGRLCNMPGAFRFLRHVSRYSFFVFVAHEPVLTIVRRVYFAAINPSTPPAIFAAYFVVVGLTILALVATYRAAEHLCPRLLNVMTGGRA